MKNKLVIINYKSACFIVRQIFCSERRRRQLFMMLISVGLFWFFWHSVPIRYIRNLLRLLWFESMSACTDAALVDQACLRVCPFFHPHLSSLARCLIGLDAACRDYLAQIRRAQLHTLVRTYVLNTPPCFSKRVCVCVCVRVCQERK